jgi:sRNA-binding regulator protein Hfq
MRVEQHPIFSSIAFLTFMANPSPVPMTGARSSRSDDSATDSKPQATEESSPSPTSVPPSGPRKLVRPTLPARALGGKYFSRRNDPPPLAHHEFMTGHNGHESNSHAEAFYFQKQAQTQTLMVFILEDGERIEGHIEWYDRNAIKVKNHSRTLIYKSSIKYLYKASDHHQHG